MEYISNINSTVIIIILAVSTVVIIVLAKLFISRQRLARMSTEFRTRKDGTKYPLSKGGKQYKKVHDDEVATTGEYKQVLEDEGHKTKSVDNTYICMKDSTKDNEVLVKPITTDEDNFQSYHCPICGSSELQKQ